MYEDAEQTLSEGATAEVVTTVDTQLTTVDTPYSVLLESIADAVESIPDAEEQATADAKDESAVNAGGTAAAPEDRWRTVHVEEGSL